MLFHGGHVGLHGIEIDDESGGFEIEDGSPDHGDQSLVLGLVLAKNVLQGGG